MRKPAIRFTSTWVIVLLTAVVVATVTLVVTLTGQGQNVVTSRLLTASDLPAGWTVVASQPSTLDLPKSKCLSGLPTKSTANITSASVSFAERSGLPGLGEYLATGATIMSGYARSVRALATCHSLTFTQNKKTIQATISPIPLPVVGSASAAYSLRFSVAGFPIVVDIALFRTSKYLGEVIFSDSVPPQTTALGALARAAAEKANGKIVKVPAISIVSVPVLIAHTTMGDVGYREFGSGPPLVLITGYGGTMESWDPRFVDALAQHHRVVIFDNAGIGKTHSLATPLTIDAMASQTSALIDALGLKNPDVLGWSMGGMIAQALTVEHPAQVARLVLCATFPGTGTVKPTQAAINDLKSTNSTKVLSALFPSDQTAAKEAFGIATGNYPASSPAPSVVVAAQTYAVDEWFAGRDSAGGKTANINVPTLVADGSVDRLDPVINAHRLVSQIPKAKLELYSDAGHAFLFQKVITFVPTIEAFLNTH
jgi:pimeloyl-ACP methyl ester carboxylesterase